MKKIVLIIAIFPVIFLSCQKEIYNHDEQMKVYETDEEISPLVFNSIDDVKNSLNILLDAEYNGIQTKTISFNPEFLSYAETAMQEVGYDDKNNAIISEVFGSILNPAGEVIFGNYMLKVCDYGILYSTVTNANTLRSLVATKYDINKSNVSHAINCPIPLNNPDLIYVLDGYDDIYIYDTFGILSEVETKSDPFGDKKYIVDGSLFQMGLNWSKGYTYPSVNQQKTIFSSDNKIANDTKIYKRDAGIYAESGVKVKTMKKGFLGTWSKFTAPVRAAIVGLVIKEENWSTDNVPAGWIDINQVDYAGKKYTIATKKLSGAFNPAMSEASLLNDCSEAIKWGQSKGINVSDIDGVRYFSGGAQNVAYVRIKDNIKEGNVEKHTVFFNLEYGGRYGTGESMGGPVSPLINVRKHTGNYKVFGVTMYGWSQHNNETKGAKMIYTFESVN